MNKGSDAELRVGWRTLELAMVALRSEGHLTLAAELDGFGAELLEALKAFEDAYLPSGLRDTNEWRHVRALTKVEDTE